MTLVNGTYDGENLSIFSPKSSWSFLQPCDLRSRIRLSAGY
jgi:hypothetical protein